MSSTPFVELPCKRLVALPLSPKEAAEENALADAEGRARNYHEDGTPTAAHQQWLDVVSVVGSGEAAGRLEDLRALGAEAVKRANAMTERALELQARARGAKIR